MSISGKAKKIGDLARSMTGPPSLEREEIEALAKSIYDEATFAEVRHVQITDTQGQAFQIPVKKRRSFESVVEIGDVNEAVLYDTRQTHDHIQRFDALEYVPNKEVILLVGVYLRDVPMSVSGQLVATLGSHAALLVASPYEITIDVRKGICTAPDDVMKNVEQPFLIKPENDQEFFVTWKNISKPPGTICFTFGLETLIIGHSCEESNI